MISTYQAFHLRENWGITKVNCQVRDWHYPGENLSSAEKELRADYDRHRCVQYLMFTGKSQAQLAITGARSVMGSRSHENFKTTEQAWLDMRESGRAVDASKGWSGRLSGR